MLKKMLLAAVLALGAAVASAAVEINTASQAELETVKGLGPKLSQRILDERAKGPFKDWLDVVRRVRGVGGGNAARLSSGGLMVDSNAYSGAMPEKKKGGAALTPPPSAASRPSTATAGSAPASSAGMAGSRR